ncbi:hypothetical protein D9M71_699240 [compost metagenome]
MAPRVVSFFQYIESSSTGKLQLAAIENARPTMNAMFCFSNRMPRPIANTPRATVVIFETRISSFSTALPFLITLAYRSWDTAEAPARVRPATTARMVAKATAEMKPRNTLPPTALAKCTAAMLLPPNSAPAASLKAGLVLTSRIAPKPMIKVRM